MMNRKKLVIVGGGSSALLLACELNLKIFDVHIYDSNAALGRKFLVAGDGGLNLTHVENPVDFLKRYNPSAFIQKAFNDFNNDDLRRWLKEKLDIDTYVGSSGKIFPIKGIKPIQVLNRFLSFIKSNGATIHYKHTLKSINETSLVFETPEGDLNVTGEIVVFCLGGASWPVTGSNGLWAKLFTSKNIQTNQFEPSNCSFKMEWPDKFKKNLFGQALKNCVYKVNDKTSSGETVITEFGIEGNGVYPLSEEIRMSIRAHQKALLSIDFKPQLTINQIKNKLESSKETNRGQTLKISLKLNPIQIELVKQQCDKNDYLDNDHLAKKLKNIQLEITDCGDIKDAISSAGGIALSEINENFELKKWPGHFAIGEMLDYDAPTGGYLLQSCFSMAHQLAKHLNTYSKS